jgi:hypothetical protein
VLINILDATDACKIEHLALLLIFGATAYNNLSPGNDGLVRVCARKGIVRTEQEKAHDDDSEESACRKLSQH